jgi:hypothetical protein
MISQLKWNMGAPFGGVIAWLSSFYMFLGSLFRTSATYGIGSSDLFIIGNISSSWLAGLYQIWCCVL